MHKIIYESFEIDLSNTAVTITEENYWFSDGFYTKYSFPFTTDLTPEMQLAFENLIDYQSTDITTEYEVVYVFNNILEKAILIVESVFDVLNFQLKYGIDEFPNFNKKLSEIELQKTTVADIYAHAKTVIEQNWPDVNYNFPQIHTDKIDVTQSMWIHFGKILNNYKDDDFVINEVIGDETYNRNLMQPMPYFLHILTQGFAQAGYTLKGDVLDIEPLQKKLLYCETSYHKILDQVNIATNVMGADKISSSGNEASFLETITLPQAGKYNITGTVYLSGRWNKWVGATLKYREKTIWTASKYEKKHHSGFLYSYDFDVDFETVNEVATHELVFTSSQFNNEDAVICDFTTTSLYLYNEVGVIISNVVNNNTVDLSKLVPDITFGTFVTAIKNWYNLGLNLKGNEIYMDLIEKEINYDDAFDLSDFETVPERTFDKGQSFLLKFSDPLDEKNKHKEMFFNADGYTSSGFVKDDKTTEIQIQAFPLLNAFREGVQTAYAIESEPNKIYAVLYDGLNAADLNLTLDPAPMLLINVFETFYRNWFEFRLFAINFKWSFSSFAESLSGLSVKKRVYAFGRFLIVKTLTKKQTAKDQFDVDVDAYSLK